VVDSKVVSNNSIGSIVLLDSNPMKHDLPNELRVSKGEEARSVVKRQCKTKDYKAHGCQGYGNLASFVVKHLLADE
tara:strand:- start:288 stop:515 length:228 start_codon:yes stop_codon:yes gene_type:complete